MADANLAIREFLKGHRLAILATGRRDGSPQQSLVAYQFNDRDIVISTRASAAKVKNVRRQSGVSLCVTEGPQNVVVYGRARVIDDPETVLEYLLTRLASPRRGGRRDRDVTARKVEEETRVVLEVVPEKFLPSRLAALE